MKGTAKSLEVPRPAVVSGALGWLTAVTAVLVAAAAILYASLGGDVASAQSSGSDSGICDRTEIVRNAILQELPDVSDCADVTDTHLASITGEIIMLDKGTITLQDGDFEGLSNLDVLYLHHNDLSSIPEDALDGLTGLEDLYLYNNTLTTLPSGVFDDLSSLEKLELSYNSMTSLPADVFEGLSKLEDLSLANNSLTALPEGIFDDLSALTDLNLNSNSLSSLPDGVFEGLSSLEDLRLAGNSGSPFTFTAELESTDEGVVVKVPEGAPFDIAVALSADGGTLSSSSVTIEGGSTTSTAVTVTPSGNDAVTVSVDSVAFPTGDPYVSEGIQTGTGNSVTIAGTGDDGICGRTLEVQTAILAELDGVSNCADVTDSHLSGISPRRLEVSGVTSLKSGDFLGLSNLERLEISYGLRDSTSGTRSMPEDIFDGLDSLTDLDLSGNDLTSLPKDIFDGLDSLTDLDLSANDLTSLPKDIFDGLTKLEKLELSNNDLTTLPEGIFDGLDSLTNLDLSGNDLTSLPKDIFDGLTKLEKLELSNNDLTTLPEGIFDGLTSMWKVKLGFNDLSSLPEDVFDGLSSLRELWLYYNELSTLPARLFDGLSSLTNLFLDGNDVSSLPDDVFDGIPNVDRLQVDGNELSSLPAGVFDGLTELDWLEMQENPGSPFTFTAELESTDDGVVVKVSEGAPFNMAVTLSAQGATLSSTTVTVAAGSTTSEAVTVTPTGTSDATVSVDSVTFQGGRRRNGIQTGTGESLTIAVNSPATGAPTISGTPQVGHTLTAATSGIQDADGLTNVTYRYQWLSSGDTVIDGANGSTYVLQSSDATKTISVRVTFTDGEGNEETLTSAATTAVAPGGL